MVWTYACLEEETLTDDELMPVPVPSIGAFAFGMCDDEEPKYAPRFGSEPPLGLYVCIKYVKCRKLNLQNDINQQIK